MISLCDSVVVDERLPFYEAESRVILLPFAPKRAVKILSAGLRDYASINGLRRFRLIKMRPSLRNKIGRVQFDSASRVSLKSPRIQKFHRTVY